MSHESNRDDYLTPDQMLDKLRSCFAPLRCEADLLEDGARVDFRIFDGEERLMRAEGTPTIHLCNPQGFQDITGTARQMLASRGYRLDPIA